MHKKGINKIWSGVVAVILTALSMLGILGILVNIYDGMISVPTPVPLGRICIENKKTLEEVTTRFLDEVMLVNPNDFAVTDRYTSRPSAKIHSGKVLTNTQIHSIIFQAQKPGTGKYIKGRYDIYFDDQDCFILLTKLDW